MSFMDTLFGGTDDSAQKAQMQANQLDRELFNRNANQGRHDARRAFSAGAANERAGVQGALNILGQTIPQQMGLYQDGNVAAQELLLAGLPQIQNALMGLPTDLTGLQPTRLEYDTSFAQQQLPKLVRPGLTKLKRGGDI